MDSGPMKTELMYIVNTFFAGSNCWNSYTYRKMYPWVVSSNEAIISNSYTNTLHSSNS